MNNHPFLLKPAPKDYLWGGTRLKDDFGKETSLDTLAETWECSTHPEGLSLVAGGKYAGKTLKEVLQKHPEYLGVKGRATENGEIPILVKLIDARENLSVQVHPDDAYAAAHEKGAMGKTEMWYVLDAEKDAELVYGLRWNMDRQTLQESIEAGTIEKYLQKIKVKTDDVFYLEAGTIHAIGAGILIAEIQENSNLTYRLYDYDRLDKNGQKRSLHVQKALEAADLRSSAEPLQPMRVLKYKPGFASELLCRCKYFQVERVLINTERYREMVTYGTGSLSFEVLLCVKGCGILLFEGEVLSFCRGDCIFVPADSARIKIHGSAQLLKIYC